MCFERREAHAARPRPHAPCSVRWTISSARHARTSHDRLGARHRARGHHRRPLLGGRRTHPMCPSSATGTSGQPAARCGSASIRVWRSSSGAQRRHRLEYEIVGANGTLLPLKADPVGSAPSCARLPRRSCATREFAWNDGEWMAARATRDRGDADGGLRSAPGPWRRRRPGFPLRRAG
jgi:hypothetical protein